LQAIRPQALKAHPGIDGREKADDWFRIDKVLSQGSPNESKQAQGEGLK